MRILGIDEAGRGPILGPLVMAGLVLPEEQKQELLAKGVADSKLFGSTPKAQKTRAELAAWLAGEFEHHILLLPSTKVDQAVAQKGLNRLEQEAAQEIMQALSWDRAILDGANLFNPLSGPKVQALNQADRDHVEVAAASILAKHHRDTQLELLLKPWEKAWGKPIAGGGYANPKTLEFVTWFLQSQGCLPPFYRKSYKWRLLEDSRLFKASPSA